MRSEKELRKRIKDLLRDRSIKLKDFNKCWNRKKSHSHFELAACAEYIDGEFSPIDNELATLFWVLGLVDDPDVESIADVVEEWTKKR